MNASYDTIVVPLDLGGRTDRALGIARVLANRGKLPVQLVTVTSPGALEELDVHMLMCLAHKHGLTRWEAVSLRSDDPAAAIALHLATMNGPLVVMSSDARGPIGSLFAASTCADLLSLVNVPVLVVGPKVTSMEDTDQPTLVSCVDDPRHGRVAVSAVAQWASTFDGPTPWFVEVVTSDTDRPRDCDMPGAELVRHAAGQCAAMGLPAEWAVLHDSDTAAAVDRFATGVDPVILVAVSERWAEPGRSHPHSVTRKLVHRSSHPVLVVPCAHERTVP